MFTDYRSFATTSITKRKEEPSLSKLFEGLFGNVGLDRMPNLVATTRTGVRVYVPKLNLDNAEAVSMARKELKGLDVVDYLYVADGWLVDESMSSDLKAGRIIMENYSGKPEVLMLEIETEGGCGAVQALVGFLQSERGRPMLFPLKIAPEDSELWPALDLIPKRLM